MGTEPHTKRMILTQEQAEALADKIKENTPENTHAKGATFQWVHLTFGNKIPGNLRRAVIKAFSKYYVVYLSKKGIPLEKISGDRHRIDGFIDGFSFHLESVNFKNHHTVEVYYSDWEGNLSASGRTVTYSWDGKAWVIKEAGPMWIS